FINQHLRYMNISIVSFPGYKPYLLIRAFGELVVSGIGLIKNDPAIGYQLQVLKELAVMFPGFGNPDKLRYLTEGIHQRMHFEPPCFPGPIQPVAAYAPKDFTE